MEKRCISILECKAGDVIAQKVVSEFGGTVLLENTTVNNYIKNKLEAFKIKYVWIYGEAREEVIKQENIVFTQLKNRYIKNVVEVKELLNDLSKGKNVTFDKINTISNSIYESINNEYFVVRCLRELSSVGEEEVKHSVNVSLYAMLLGKWLLLPESKIANLIHAGLLHDIGKIKIPNSILNKKENLEKEEYEQIKKHPVFSYEIIKDIEGVSEECREAVLMHHEREDKSGYPSGISGSEISTCSKIIALANFYDSITSERSYRKKVTPFEAFAIIQSEVVKRFDIHIVNTFLSNLGTCYVGTKVLLSNKTFGEIVYVPPQAIDKPIILVNSDYIDLSKESNFKIIIKRRNMMFDV